MTKIEFFLEGESLGTYECPDNSGHDQRVQVANDNNIVDFDKFILGDGRVVAELCKGRNLYSHGEQVWSWNIEGEDNEERDAIHLWFGLSYASYLVIPRTTLQSMPDEWQQKFVELLNNIWETLNIPKEPNYQVQSRNEKGKFITDPLANYERGRRKLQIIKK